MFETIDVIIGIDQTGAKKSNGLPKPLPCALLIKRGEDWILSDCDHLAQFSCKDIQQLLWKHKIENPCKKNIFILVDCVLGLPSPFQQEPQPFDQLKSLIQESCQQQGWGLNAGEQFFNGLLKKYDFAIPPTRQVEDKHSANSVFRNQPRQRNIQTGTFRIWKELAQTKTIDQISLWPFHPLENDTALTVAEGYPTLAWKYMNNSPRSAFNMEALFKKTATIKEKEKIQTWNPDHKDAGLLALYSWYLFKTQSFNIPKDIDIEGAIFSHH